MYDNETSHISSLHALNIQMTTLTKSAHNNHQSQIGMLHVSVSACECEFMRWGVVSGCHVNHSGSHSLSITAVCCGNYMQPDFNITWAEWHLTQVCVIVCTLLCMCIILRVIVFSFPPLPCFESHRDGRPWPRVCVWVCVFACACTYCNSLILNRAYLPPVTLISISCSSPYISYLQSWKPRAADMDGIFIILLIFRPCYFSLFPVFFLMSFYFASVSIIVHYS